MLVDTLILWCINIALSLAFKDELLKTCANSGFCQRNRDYANNIMESKSEYYSIDPSGLHFNAQNHSLVGIITKTVLANQETKEVPLLFWLDLLEGDKIRFRIEENRPISEGNSNVNPYRYNKTEKWAFDPNFKSILSGTKLKQPGFFSGDKFVLQSQNLVIDLSFKVFKITIYYKSKHILTINDKSLLNFEHFRRLDDNYENVNKEESTFNMFKDSFVYSKGDSIPLGPESVALDFTFNGFQNLYGIPEHADSLRLRDTSTIDPYRLFNVDVFEYNLNSTMPMYGSVPFLVGVNPHSSVGLFWINPSDTWIDVKYEDENASTHWMSESGIIDVMIFAHETPKEVTQSYLEVTGNPMLPLLSSIGYHQCRWNYNDEKDVLTVDAMMDKWQFPYDFIWLDLEYTNEKKYFTWKSKAFPNPKRLLSNLARTGRNLAVLIDPHLKVGYEISEQVSNLKLAVTNSMNELFVGQCWPGESVWIDTFSEKASALWSQFMVKFLDSTKNLHIWNDMNEPSIFSGSETTAPKDLLHYEGYEERSVHNLYGLTVHESTYEGMLLARPNSRPFILTRSFFSGSQRTAATWTGDNVGSWDYLKISVPMCLSSNVAGMPFIGADVAGFFGDPDEELMVRWYQTGIWYPFFRGHAHIDSKRREPYLLNEPARSMIREAVKLRYQLMPTFYTAFHDSHTKGSPIMSPLFYEHPELQTCYNIDDQFYLGEQGILVKPVTSPKSGQVSFFFPPGIFYDLQTLEIGHQGKSLSKDVNAPLDKIPAFIEGGHIISTKSKFRRSAKLMEYDPITLVVAASENSEAKGKLYVDDGETFDYLNGDYVEVLFELKGNKLLGKPTSKQKSSMFENLVIENIHIAFGHELLSSSNVKLVEASSSRTLSTSINNNVLTIDHANIKIGSNWSITL